VNQTIYEEVGQKHTLVVHFVGVANEEDVLEMQEHAIQRDKEFPEFSLVVDFSRSTELAIDHKSVFKFIKVIRKRGRRKGRTAIVVGDYTFRITLAHLFIAMVNKVSPSPYRIFDSIVEAISWANEE